MTPIESTTVPTPRSASAAPDVSLRDEFRLRLRDRALDAAATAVLQHGWQHVRLAGLARQTGISRATLYRQFDGKDGLATALLTREGDRFLLRIDRALEEATSWESGLREALVISLAVRDDHPLLASALVGRGDVPFALQTVTKPLVADACSLLSAFLRIHRPGLAAPYLDDVADTLVRATMSHLISPDDAAPAVERLHRLSRHLLAHPSDGAVRAAHRPTS